MKKIILSAVLMLTVTANVFALEFEDYKVISKLNNTTTLRSLARYLDVNSDQAEKINLVFEMTETKISDALNAGCEVSAEKALDFNLGNLKLVLSPEQYKKYLVVLNLTVAGNEDVLVAEN